MTDPLFENFYRCEACGGREWRDYWQHQCNDRCPVCQRETEPYKSFEVDPEQNVAEGWRIDVD